MRLGQVHLAPCRHGAMNCQEAVPKVKVKTKGQTKPCGRPDINGDNQR